MGAPPADDIAAVAPVAVHTLSPDDRTWNQHLLPTFTLRKGATWVGRTPQSLREPPHPALSSEAAVTRGWARPLTCSG